VHYGASRKSRVKLPHGRVSYNGFPFFPGQQRELRAAGNEPQKATQVVLRFKESKVTHPLTDADAAPHDLTSMTHTPSHTKEST